MNNASSSSLIHKLRKKNYIVHQERHFLMPYNIIFRFPDSVVKSLLLYLDPLVSLFVKDILEGKEEKISSNVGIKIISYLLRIEWIAPKVNHLFFHSDKKKCIHCNLCLKNCPMHAIYVNKKGRMKATRNCALCMNCTMICPKDAIHFGFLNNWKVNGYYPYRKIRKDESIEPANLESFRKGFFHSYKSYFTKADQELEEAKIPLPLSKEDKKNE